MYLMQHLPTVCMMTSPTCLQTNENVQQNCRVTAIELGQQSGSARPNPSIIDSDLQKITVVWQRQLHMYPHILLCKLYVTLLHLK